MAFVVFGSSLLLASIFGRESFTSQARKAYEILQNAFYDRGTDEEKEQMKVLKSVTQFVCGLLFVSHYLIAIGMIMVYLMLMFVFMFIFFPGEYNVTFWKAIFLFVMPFFGVVYWNIKVDLFKVLSKV